jgi:hypothetical protein
VKKFSKRVKIKKITPKSQVRFFWDENSVNFVLLSRSDRVRFHIQVFWH